MSQENIEIVREHIDAYLHDDASRSLSFVDPYVVVDRSRIGTVDSDVVYGQEALVKAVRRQVGAFEEYAFEVERLTDLGSGAILAVVTETGRRKGSGVPVRRSFCGALYRDRRQDRADNSVPEPGTGPPSRRAAGVVQKYRFGRRAVAELLRRAAAPLRDEEQCAGLPLHYLFGAFPVGGNV